MGMFKWRSFTPASFYLFLLTLFICSHHISASLEVDLCKVVFCGMGTCHLDHTALLGFRCDCNSGWTELPIWPICIVPNCTIDFKQCGAPPPKPPSSFFNLSNPCLINFCGDGECHPNGFLDFTCECHEGSANLLRQPKWPCFKKCTIGADCAGIDLSFPSSPTPPSTPPPPPPPLQNSGSPGSGFGAMRNSSREFHMLAMMILATIFLNWI